MENKKQTKNYKPGYSSTLLHWVWGWIDVNSITLPYYQPTNKLQIDKAGDKVLLSDNYQVNLVATVEAKKNK